MAFKILISQSIGEEHEAALRELGCEIFRGTGTDFGSVKRDVADCDAMVVFGTAGYTIGKEIIDAGKKLKLLSRFGVGMDIIDVPYAIGKGIAVANMAGATTNAVAEHTIYLMLACAKNAHANDLTFRGGAKHDFADIGGMFATELTGRVLGVAGCGRIGQEVARKAALGLGMRVIGYDPFLPKERFPDFIEYAATCDEVIEAADFLSLHIPATEETFHMFGAPQFARMKPTAYLINAARGSIVDEHALAEALRSGVIAGAGLDVYEVEPLPQDSPLFELPSCVLTPHCAAGTRDGLENSKRYTFENIRDFLEGKAPAHVVRG